MLRAGTVVPWKRCPNIREYNSTSINRDVDVVPEIAIHLQKGQLQHLEAVELDVADDSPLSACLSAMSRVKKVKIRDGALGPRSFEMLTRHFSTLRAVAIPPNSTIPGALILNVLESCPMLTYF